MKIDEIPFYAGRYASPLGDITLIAHGEQLISAGLKGQKHGPQLPQNAKISTECPAIFDAARRWFDRYFAGERPSPADIDTEVRGTDFQKKVWALLRQIPYGQTISYGQLSKVLAAESPSGRMSAQAIGGAVGRNPLCIIVPCHRVVGADGSLTGYDGGVHYKEWLLRHENALPKGL